MIRLVSLRTAELGIYGVASMTAQRALRELQHLRITYGVPGKGTFVHPDAFDYLQGAALREPIADDDSDLRRRVADYLATQQEIVRRLNTAATAADRNAALADLLAHADTHRDLIEEATRYQTSHGNFATDPFADRREPADQPSAAKRTARTRKTEK
ncbi:hypothetical protein [Micromonospora sp. NPDC050495]|uniref:hypothetical protein n=1 Tax=Micromonospora sp. NPDC050495 TaxID=3154936 RepID=UPI0033EB7934